MTRYALTFTTTDYSLNLTVAKFDTYAAAKDAKRFYERHDPKGLGTGDYGIFEDDAKDYRVVQQDLGA